MTKRILFFLFLLTGLCITAQGQQNGLAHLRFDRDSISFDSVSMDRDIDLIQISGLENIGHSDGVFEKMLGHQNEKYVLFWRVSEKEGIDPYPYYMSLKCGTRATFKEKEFFTFLEGSFKSNFRNLWYSTVVMFVDQQVYLANFIQYCIEFMGIQTKNKNVFLAFEEKDVSGRFKIRYKRVNVVDLLEKYEKLKEDYIATHGPISIPFYTFFSDRMQTFAANDFDLFVSKISKPKLFEALPLDTRN